MEEDLVFVKPANKFSKPAKRDGKVIKEIFDFLEKRLYGFDFERIIGPVLVYPAREILEKHYSNIRDKPYFEPTIFYLCKYGVTLAIYRGEKGLVNTIRNIVGDTDPKKAECGTIRRTFSEDSLELALKELRYLDNVIHASGDATCSKKEIVLWRETIQSSLYQTSH